MNNIERFYFKSSKHTGFFWDCKLLEHYKSDYQDIKMVYHPEMGNTLILDDYIMVTEKDEHQYHELITHPNCLQLHQHRQALIIGGGDGLCAEEVLKYPFDKVTLVEIDEEVSRACRRHFQSNLNGVFHNPRFETRYQDALAFFPNEYQYDFISLDLNDPAEDFMHSHPLYSEEFYTQCKKSLSQEGIMVVQIGCPYLFTAHFKRNYNLLISQFKHVVVYGMYMRCYGTYQFFAACSDFIDLNSPNISFMEKNIKKFGISELKLYNTDMHIGMLKHNNEINQIIKGE